MVDNVAITAGSGTTVAADDIGAGVLAQRVKVVWGPDGTGNDTDVATGKPIPAQLRVSDGTAWTYGSGVLGAGTPRVTLATDSPGVTALGNTTMSGSLPVTLASDQTWPVSTVGFMKKEDVASADGDAGIPAMAIQQSTPADTAGSNADYAMLQMSGGRLWVSSPPTQGYSAAVTLTRTNDTNVYAANDILGAATGSTAALTFASMGPSAQEVIITSASLEIDATAVISGETSYRLYLYNVTPPSATGDNGAWDLPSGDRASFLGYVDLGTPVDLGSTLYVQTDGINKQVKLAGTSLFAYLVTIGTYTPTASRVHVITLHTVAP